MHALELCVVHVVSAQSCPRSGKGSASLRWIVNAKSTNCPLGLFRALLDSLLGQDELAHDLPYHLLYSYPPCLRSTQLSN